MNVAENVPKGETAREVIDGVNPKWMETVSSSNPIPSMVTVVPIEPI
jgi:hypothetical protein